MIVSVVSVAVNMGEPAVVEVTVKVTTPLEFEAPEAAEMVSVEPLEEARVPVLPETGLEFRSLRVTVTVEAVEPFAGTDVGLATTVD